MATGVDLQCLRACLLSQPHKGEGIAEDGLAAHDVLTPAAVLVPIVLHQGRPSVLLTQRTAHLRDHAGQISFPGGRIEDTDRSVVDAALREAEEEVGLPPERIQVVGFLPEYRTGTGFSVTPVVAFVPPLLALQPDPFEVAEVFEVPLAFLLDPANHQQHEVYWRGKLRQYYAIPYGDRFIWGATAGMLISLFNRFSILRDA